MKKKVEKIEQRTVKVELSCLEDWQKNAISSTMEECGRLFDFVVELCNKEKTFSYYTICGPQFYGELTAKFPNLPTALVQCVGKLACASVKGWNTKHKNNPWKCEAKKETLSYPLNKLTLSRRGDLTSICVIGKRVRTIVKLPQWFVEKYGVKGDNIQAGQIKKVGEKFFLYLIYKVEPTNCNAKGIVGVDRGLYNLATLSNGAKFGSKKAIAVKRRYQYLRKKLQQKGTRSAKRKLRKRSGREKRFMRDFNHIVTKRLAEMPEVKTFVLENLEGIRKKRKGTKLNSWLSNWSYYEFQQQLEYKCSFVGKEVVYVDPAYTSQKCSLCGNVDKKSRNKSRYRCPICGHKQHADVNAAINIRDNYVLSCKRNRVLSTTQTTQGVPTLFSRVNPTALCRG